LPNIDELVNHCIITSLIFQKQNNYSEKYQLYIKEIYTIVIFNFIIYYFKMQEDTL